MQRAEPTTRFPNSPPPSVGEGRVAAASSRRLLDPRIFAQKARGFTLFELLLVLALIVVLGGLVAPALSGAFTHSKLNSAADDIQSAWSEARLAAIEQGRPVAFRCLIGGTEFETTPYVFGLDEVDTGSTEIRAERIGAGVEEDAEETGSTLASGDLADGLTFSEAAAANALDSTDPGVSSSVRDRSGWSPPIIFYPDGQSSDALVRIAHEEGRGITVTLRGLTGVSRKSEVGSSGVPVEEAEE